MTRPPASPMRATWPALLLALIGCGGAAAGADSPRLPPDASWVLEQPDSVEILSLEPTMGPAEEAAGGPDFHGYRVLGRASLATRDDRRAFVEPLLVGIEDGGAMAKCFKPRHAAVVRRGGRQVDVVACYECSQVQIVGPGETNQVTVATSTAPEKRLDALFASKGLTRAP